MKKKVAKKPIKKKTQPSKFDVLKKTLKKGKKHLKVLPNKTKEVKPKKKQSSSKKKIKKETKPKKKLSPLETIFNKIVEKIAEKLEDEE